MVCMLNRQGTQHHPLVSLDILDIAAFRPWKMLGMFQPPGTQTTRACTNLCVFSLDFHQVHYAMLFFAGNKQL